MSSYSITLEIASESVLGLLGSFFASCPEIQPIVAKMTEKQSADFLIDLRQNMKLSRERKKQKLLAK
jgi:hypothetical protein